MQNLDRTIQQAEKNYAGFPAKVTRQTKSRYNQLVANVKSRARTEQGAKKCYYILRDYVRFFNDKHFIISYRNENDFDKEQLSYNEDRFKKYLQSKMLHPVEGLWINPDTSLTLSIQKAANNSYKGIVVSAKDPKLPQGFVYFTLTTSGTGFKVKEYNSFLSTDIPAVQRGNLLQLWNHAMFGKVFPQSMTTGEANELSTWRNNNNGLDFKKVNASTAYLKIPTFYNNDSKIQNLISANDSVIRSTKNLIIDLRGNGGGNTGWVYFLPYLMTGPIVQHDSYVRVSEDNVKLKLKDLEPFVNNPIPDEYKKYFPEQVLAAYKKAYAELPVTKLPFYPIPGVTFPLDSVTQFPKKVALIFDGMCGSSTEYFFFISSQSKKVLRYGSPTIGMMDYEGMSTPTPLPYDKFILTIPIVKSSWTGKSPIDATGFKPEIRLDKQDPAKWVDFVAEDMRKR